MATSTQRNQNLELVRIVSAFGIVLFHAGAPAAGIGYGGLIAFAAMSLYFAAASDGAPRTTMALARTLLLPWLFWWLVYGAMNVVLRGYLFAPELGIASAILFGTSQHLWYLPFAFAALLLVERTRVLASPAVLMAGFGLAGMAMLLLAGSWRGPSLTMALPLPQVIHAFPAVLLGAAMGFASRLGSRWVAATLGLLAVATALWVQVPGVTLPYAVGLGGIVLARELPSIRFNLEPVSRCMFGVYLTHVAWLSVFNRVLGEHQLSTVVAAFVAATASVWIARKLLPKSRLVLG